MAPLVDKRQMSIIQMLGQRRRETVDSGEENGGVENDDDDDDIIINDGDDDVGVPGTSMDADVRRKEKGNLSRCVVG